VASLMTSRPDVVFTSLYSGDAATFAKQARTYGFFNQIKFMANPSDETDIPQILGKNMFEEWAAANYYYKSYDNKANNRFVKDYQKVYSEIPTGYALPPYEALWVFKAAAEKAGSLDTGTLISALEGLEIETVSGKIHIRAEDHQAIKNDVVMHIIPKKEDPGWAVTEWVVVPGEKIALPPHPGTD